MIYLLHFETPLKHARHYLGFTEMVGGLDARLAKHSSGHGARLMAAVSQAGIGFVLARTWKDGDRNYERHLKNSKNTPRLCPICNPKAMNYASKEFTSTDNYTLSKNIIVEESATYNGITVAIDSTQLVDTLKQEIT